MSKQDELVAIGVGARLIADLGGQREFVVVQGVRREQTGRERQVGPPLRAVDEHRLARGWNRLESVYVCAEFDVDGTVQCAVRHDLWTP